MKKLKQTNEAEAQNSVFSKKNNRKKHTYLLIEGILVVLLLASSLIQIAVSNSLITKGITLSQIQQEIAQTKKENLLLSEKLYTDSSYTHIASEAATLGFVEAKTPVYLTNSMPIAIR